nr:hypothetical protein [Tanacetum cinerariifolium]
MPYGATTLAKHVMEVRYVIWMKKIQDVWRVGKILISKILWWMVNVFKWSGSNPSGGFRNPGGGHERRGGGDGFEGPVANCPSLTHKSYYVTFVVEEVFEVGYLTLILAVFLLKFGEFVLDELVRLYVRNVKKMVFEGDDYKNSRKDGASLSLNDEDEEEVTDGEATLNSRKDGASLSLNDEDEEEVTDGEATLFPFSLVGFLEMSKGSMTHSWNVNLSSGTMA